MGAGSAARDRLRQRLPLLMLVTDRRRLTGRALVDVVAQAVAGGVNAVQLRERDLPAGELFELALAVRRALGDRALLFVNDRLDVALAAGADGIQLPEQGLPPEAVRRVGGRDLIIGRSVHDADGARRAEDEGADLLVAGHVFQTTSKPDSPPLGGGGFSAIRAATGLPLVAIGGITQETAAQTVEWGADGVAAISALLEAPDPTAAARLLWQAVSRR